MAIIWIVVLAIVLAFEFVALFLGAPYLRTLRAQREAVLDVLDLKKGQVFVDLGCGDGVVLKAAAKRGLKAVGYEINPLLVVIARLNNWRYRNLVKVKWGNFWNQDSICADGIFVFLKDSYMGKLDNYMKSEKTKKPVKLVSYAFKIPGKKVAKQQDAIFLYSYK